jgi:hypothetical protein
MSGLRGAAGSSRFRHGDALGQWLDCSPSVSSITTRFAPGLFWFWNIVTAVSMP